MWCWTGVWPLNAADGKGTVVAAAAAAAAEDGTPVTSQKLNQARCRLTLLKLPGLRAVDVRGRNRCLMKPRGAGRNCRRNTLQRHHWLLWQWLLLLLLLLLQFMKATGQLAHV